MILQPRQAFEQYLAELNAQLSFQTKKQFLLCGLLITLDSLFMRTLIFVSFDSSV